MSTIVHMDLDAFFVSVACLENTALRGKPVIIGGFGGGTRAKERSDISSLEQQGGAVAGRRFFGDD